MQEMKKTKKPFKEDRYWFDFIHVLEIDNKNNVLVMKTVT